MEKTWEEIKKENFNPYKFNVSTVQTTISKNIPVERGCNSVQVTNLGTCVVDFNGITLFPSATPATVAGDSISFGGNLGETYKGDITITMMLPLGAAPLVEITQKYYINFE